MLLDRFLEAYKTSAQTIRPTFNHDLFGVLDLACYTLMNEKFLPSRELKEELKNLRTRSLEPIKIAIIGQFSSGKSTFLNAILPRPILPTGITPITSKVCYIQYGEALSLELLLKDGRREFHEVEQFKKISEAQGEQIERLTLYVPLEILKEITFLDTPGFNSNNASDTRVTSEILEGVDGIIWITLIDNAGKQSELEILREHLSKYAAKTLCILNQKDKFDSLEEIESSVKYVKDRFGEFFSDVIPVSSKMALQSKGFDAGGIAQQEMLKFSRELTDLAAERSFNQAKILELLAFHAQQLQEISVANPKEAMRLYRESNFQAVLDFIDQSIRPQALQTKEFTIKRKLRDVIEILKTQYQEFELICHQLLEILENYEKNLPSSLEEIKLLYKQELHRIAQDIHYHLESIAETTLKHTLQEKCVRLLRASPSIAQRCVATERTFLVSRLDRDRLHQEFFLSDSPNNRFFKALQFKIRRIAERMEESFEGMLKGLEQKIWLWQESNELARKRHPLGSDGSYANMKKLAAKAYELITKDFVAHHNVMSTFIHAELDSLFILFGGAHEKMLELALLQLENRFEKSLKQHLKNPQESPIYHPTLQELETLLGQSFALYTYLPKIEGEATVADKAYQKMFAGSHRLLGEKRLILKEWVDLIQEREAELDLLLEKLA